MHQEIFYKKIPNIKFYKNLIIGSHTVSCRQMDGQKDKLYTTALQTCLKPNSFTINILPSLSTYVYNTFKIKRFLLQEF